MDIMENNYRCYKCNKEIDALEIRQFGRPEDDKAIYCPLCWDKMLEFLKIKWFKEKPEELFMQLNKILRISKEQKKKLASIIIKTEYSIKCLKKICKQDTLKLQEKPDELIMQLNEILKISEEQKKKIRSLNYKTKQLMKDLKKFLDKKR